MKKEKMNGIIQRELSDILQTEVRDPAIGFCTITGVDIYQLLKFMFLS